MTKNERARKRILSILLACSVSATLMPFAAAAEETAVQHDSVLNFVISEETASDPCGGGHWAWDKTSRTLTLEDYDLSIDGCTNSQLIYLPENSILLLKGRNTLNADLTASGTAIWGVGDLTIRGEEGSSLSVTLKKKDADPNAAGAVRTDSGGEILLSGVDLTLINGSPDTDAKTGITTADFDSFSASIRIVNSTVAIRDYGTGIIVNGGTLEIQNSTVTAEGGTSGINCGDADISIKDSRITVSGSDKFDDTGNFPALSCGGEIGGTMTIDHSKVVAESTVSNGISSKNLFIENGSDVTAVGKYPGIYSAVKSTFENSDVDASSTQDFGLFSRGEIHFNNSNVHLKGAEGLAAAAARVVRATDEKALPKIFVTDATEENDGKIAVSDWFVHQGSGETRSYSSFIPASESALTVDGSGKMENSLNEIRLKVKSVLPTTPATGDTGSQSSNTLVKTDYKNRDAIRFTIGGKPVEGFIEFEGNWYLAGKGGYAVKDGWAKADNSWYFFNETGMMQTGWVRNGNKWYLLSGSGAMKTGWQQNNGRWYLLSDSGAMKTGWVKEGETWYLLSGSGAMKTGWVKEGEMWYLLSGSGTMKTGWQEKDSHWYFLSDAGRMQSGWMSQNGNWYYLADSGAMQSARWTRIDGKWYYFYDDGKMAVNTAVGGYRVDSTGAWVE